MADTWADATSDARVHEKIGHRLSESRYSGTSADGYRYLTNGAGGNTPILDPVNLAVGGRRDYAWDAAGNLDSVAPGGNFIDFQFDDASRLAGADRTSVGGGAAAFLYDGRGFLRSATQTAGGTASVTPLYDSAGLLHALRRQPSPTDPVDTTYVFYFAGRPVAQLEIDGTGAETWTYLTTDHLGTPLVATDQTGAITWEGGFRPFGTDYQAGTGNGASENGIRLRLPGQWVDDTWADATSGAGIYQNTWRWYAPDIGRYSRPDPLGVDPISAGLQGNPNLYTYASLNPLLLIDPTGQAVYVCSRKAFVTKITPRGLGNHSYIWDPRPGTPPDKRSCGIFSNAREKGPSMDACNIVPGSDGREDQVMECCRFLKKHPGLYVTPLNDCQTGTSRALDCAGLSKLNPGVPGGRIGLPCDQCSIAAPPLNPCPPGAAGRLRGMTTPACHP
jgi:RHS repeat-associated protein